jgi:hypothetical protein
MWDGICSNSKISGLTISRQGSASARRRASRWTTSSSIRNGPHLHLDLWVNDGQGGKRTIAWELFDEKLGKFQAKAGQTYTNNPPQPKKK